MNAYDRLMLPENLNYAWLKAKNLYRSADGYVDAGELAAFELDLEQRLLEIRRQFERGTFRLKKLRPLPRPKKLTEEIPVDRQYYHVAVEDQVAWIALVNALGPDLDMMMEPWSYGNRLYRPAWYEKDEASISTLEIGPYRHASGNLYRKFQHSWPLFRRHITLTARMMVYRRQLRRDEMDEPDQLADATARRANLIYFSQDFWPKKGAQDAKSDLYHASIDLKQFYPALKIEAVLAGLAVAGALADQRIKNIIGAMLNFQIDMTDMPHTAMENVEPPFLKGSIKGIPTGLFVAGFLANVAMLPVDKIVALKIDENRNVAHFRFVDDHTIIADDFDALCDWIIWYEQLLLDQGIGAEVNPEKYDPPNLSEWVALIKTGEPLSNLRGKKPDIYKAAVRDTRLDGKNPTKLMTKTLAQVSAIAAADIHILDDDDLSERLKMLEWLLLADIPEREIRPDTRAAFAAGQIASLVPILVQEADGLVDAERKLSVWHLRQPDAGRATEADWVLYKATLAELVEERDACLLRHDEAELSLLKRCFSLLLQSLREHPGKARLFYRIHQYCRVTGHRGLNAIVEWLKETRAKGREVWADYYVALSLQIMASGILATLRRIETPGALRSDIKAAFSHLEDIAALDAADFRVRPEREAWYHAAGRREFGVALIQAAEMLAHTEYTALAKRLATLSQAYVRVSPGAPADIWLAETARTSGVWAHLGENSLGREEGPSAAWSAFSPHFAFDSWADMKAARRYPEQLPSAAWQQLLAAGNTLPENDSAWLREVIGDDVEKRAVAQATGKNAFTRAARSLEPPPKNWMTISEWSKSVHDCNPFDPRRGEWTALEITAQLLEAATSADGEEAILDRLHPNNVLLPRRWIMDFPCNRHITDLSWEVWRHFAQDSERSRAKLREPSTSLADYRYTLESKAGLPIPDAERRLVSVGRLLLGLLRNNHAAPRIWNMRGNELVFQLPHARWFESLAISSLTTLILEGCLGARPAETRAITREPSLFGWRDGVNPNDAAFDPPLFYGSTDLLEQIRHSQKILEDNQLAVARNQPRQLIPFRLGDFAAASGDEGDGEGGNDAE